MRNLRAAPQTPERRGAVWLLSLILLLVAGCGPAPGGLQSLDGKPLRTGGKILVVNYWAEWCAPCREEIPELNTFYKAHKADVLVLGINFDQLPAEQVQHQADNFGIEFPLLATAPEGRWGQPMPQVLPSTLIIDRRGQWRRTLVGPQSAESLAAAVAAIGEEN
ncbi:TlpA disulfide reductase family protein [uncultured Microbulbifer sp.]|uniref:TlpA family protein disulfide reductase n=1 Tax=uncultured Microbulbifer sp. TaxID=348147 RepID=UPI00261D3457|nr:TlpA disulfide reductase family protein [uncultured Microbulbifer sp.]